MNLNELLDSNAPGWQPKEGDTLVGTIVAIDERESDYGQGAYPIITLKDGQTGELRAVHAFHSVLKARIAELRPSIGDDLGVKYLGQVQPKDPKGRPYHSYKAVIDRKVPQETNWDAHAADAADLARAEGAEIPAVNLDEEPF